MARVVITLEMDGTEGDALEVVGVLLDNGVPQDWNNDHEVDGCGPLHVTYAAVELVAP